MPHTPMAGIVTLTCSSCSNPIHLPYAYITDYVRCRMCGTYTIIPDKLRKLRTMAPGPHDAY